MSMWIRCPDIHDVIQSVADRLNSHQRRANTFRVTVRQMLEQGYSVSRIAKETGKSYRHVKRIVEQERGE